MPTFLTIGYGSSAGYEATAPALRDKAHAHDAWLVAQGAVMGAVGAPIQVRNPECSGVTTTDGAFMRSDLPFAGFALLEAASLDEAVARVAGTPCAVAHGVVEVWPLRGTLDETGPA
ncbi:MAG TPA: hypothetical protein VIY26_12360 [Acidimicrobiales bacterium]